MYRPGRIWKRNIGMTVTGCQVDSAAAQKVRLAQDDPAKPRTPHLPNSQPPTDHSY